jgi:hypothetical protein
MQTRKKRITFKQFQELQSLLARAHQLNIEQERIEAAACKITGQTPWSGSRTFDYIGSHSWDHDEAMCGTPDAAANLCADLNLKVGKPPKAPDWTQPFEWNAALSDFIVSEFVEASAALARMEADAPALRATVCTLAPHYLNSMAEIEMDWTDSGLRDGYFALFDSWLDREPERRELWEASGIAHADLLAG